MSYPYLFATRFAMTAPQVGARLQTQHGQSAFYLPLEEMVEIESWQEPIVEGDSEVTRLRSDDHR